MRREDRIKLFGMSHALVERDLDKIEKSLSIDLCRYEEEVKDEEYYPQFDMTLRNEAKEMGKQYELFYCLEKSIRKLVAESLEDQHGQSWWDTCVQEGIRSNVTDLLTRETDSGVTLRSAELIDYTTFGELGEIVRSNWESFDAVFSSQKAFTRIMSNLNMLRGPIAPLLPSCRG